jgi:hypothetical protein
VAYLVTPYYRRDGRTLVRVEITRDRNDDGELAYLVTPYYRRDGRTISVPDGRGWPTLAEAERIRKAARG